MLRLAAGIALVGTLCVAMPTPPPDDVLRDAFQSLLSTVDTDGDGRVSLAEFLPMWRQAQPRFGDAQFQQEFSLMDYNGDGTVDVNEFLRAAHSPPPPEIVPLDFQQEDADGDGLLSEQQALEGLSGLHLSDDPQRVSYVVHHADHNGDGSVDLAEFTAAADAIRHGTS